MRLSRLIRYPIDIISAGVVVCALSLQVVALARGWPWYTAFPIFLLLREVNLVEHNHMHLPMSSEVADHFRRLCLTVGSVSNIARHYWARLTASNMPWYKLTLLGSGPEILSLRNNVQNERRRYVAGLDPLEEWDQRMMSELRLTPQYVS